MAFISVFDVLGPIMVGPSSSHTAGTAAIAYLAQKMINGTLKKVEFTLYGSFAKTYRGHGTDRALLGGIMGFSTYDSIANLLEQYKGKRVLIVTQRYHLYRALYIAEKLGIDAYGVSANLRTYTKQFKFSLREVLARVKDVVWVEYKS